jgi:formate hydrogenlyase subunit 3/multisubunit Na+/H+ antiporter MnhD subunit
MTEFLACLVLEWGVVFIIFLATALVFGLVAIAWIARYFGLRPTKTGGGKLTLKTKDWSGTLSGSPVPFIVFCGAAVILIVVVGNAAWSAYKSLRDTYAVVLDSPDGVSLDRIRMKYQPDTQASIVLERDAGKLVVKGNFSAHCVADLLARICRQYTPQIECDTSYFRRRITIRSRSP